MTSNRDYHIPSKMLPVFHCDAAEGLSVPVEVGGLKTEGQVLAPFVNSAAPTLECTLHFSDGGTDLNGLTVAGMVLGVVTALSDADKVLGGTGLEPRGSRVSEADCTFTLHLVPTCAAGAAERFRVISLALSVGSDDQLVAQLKRVCPAATRFEIAA